MTNKMETEALLIVIFYSFMELKVLLVSFNLYINVNYREDIIIVFNSIGKYSIKSKFNYKLQW